MKISIGSATACLLFMAWLGQTQSASIDYRYKRRGPPPPPRPPLMPQYMKKWENHRPPRGSPPHGPPPRPRPIPMQVMPEFIPPPPPPPINTPIGPPVINHPPRPTPPPVRNYWKNTKPPLQTIPEKPFHFSPAISSTREFDYHVQTNNIPTHPIPIKQIDEKGPIHTIPAPNLSPADRPPVIEEVRKELKIKPPQSYQQSHRQNSVQVQVQAHQYQVTEPNDVFIKSSSKQVREQQHYYPSDQYLHQQNQNYQRIQHSVDKSPQLDTYISVQGQVDDGRLNNNEIYQMINSQIQQQQLQQQQLQQQQQQLQQQQSQIYDNYELPLVPQGLVQQPPQKEISFSDYQTLIAQSQLLQGDPSYMQQIQQLILNQNARDNVQFQNYPSERQMQNNFPNGDGQSTFITADYNFKAEDSQILQEPNKVEPNLPYVQEVYNLNEENIATHNNIEQNIKVFDQSTKANDEDMSAFYTTLPNKQAAETLASLQAAGKMNNNVQNFVQLSPQTTISQRTPLEIYVPDSADSQDSELDYDNKDGEDSGSESLNKEENSNSKETTQNKENSQNNTAKNQSRKFGTRIRPKIN